MRTPKSAANSSPSRRTVIGAASALPLASPIKGRKTDAAAELCKTWLAKNSAEDRLCRQWQKIETYVFRNYDWPRLSVEAQARFPEQAQMDELDRRRSIISAEASMLMEQIPETAATTREGVLLKFKVILEAFMRDQDPEVHALVTSAVCDLRRLW